MSVDDPVSLALFRWHCGNTEDWTRGRVVCEGWCPFLTLRLQSEAINLWACDHFQGHFLSRGRPRGERSETLVTGGRSLGETFHRLRFQSDPEGPMETKGRGRGDGGGTDGVGVAEEEG